MEANKMAQKLLSCLLVLSITHATLVVVIIEGHPIREWIRLNYMAFATVETVVFGIVLAIAAIILNLRKGSRLINGLSIAAGLTSALGICVLLGRMF
ncbi:TPA: hypothetical protein DE059_04570 [Candidatus Peribacteria bacterium]|jgi:hypothetical protein|nr:hypothetical protein [Candidatus Peribacteria bacterium]|tara:strand:+ start:360 stop:650 length:291 start_codon:yes stop_codon:yes gene_type:complete